LPPKITTSAKAKSAARKVHAKTKKRQAFSIDAKRFEIASLESVLFFIEFAILQFQLQHVFLRICVQSNAVHLGGCRGVLTLRRKRPNLLNVASANVF
jgi:hypothetical protein